MPRSPESAQNLIAKLLPTLIFRSGTKLPGFDQPIIGNGYVDVPVIESKPGFETPEANWEHQVKAWF